MPKIVTNTTQIDATRRGRVQLTGMYDGTDGQESQVVKINTWGLRGALSLASNGTQLLAGNGNPRPAYNIDITSINYAISPGGVINLAWQGTTNTQFATLMGTGALEVGRGAMMEFSSEPGGAPGHTGNVVLTTLGLGANSGYTISIDFLKDPRHFNQGQIERPKDFNIILPTGNNV
jgi:hypothetical protein